MVLGSICGQMKKRSICEYSKVRLVFYLFPLFDLFYLISCVPHMDGSDKAVGTIVLLSPQPKRLHNCLCLRVCDSICFYRIKFAVQFHTPERHSKFVLVTSRPFPKHHHKAKLKPTFYTVLLSALSSVYCENNIYLKALRNCSIIYPAVLPAWKKQSELYVVFCFINKPCL